MSASIRIVLVETSHPGNIGACARALKNMGLGELVLVRPARFPDPQASARASGAEDVLARARIEPQLDAALCGCGLVLAATSREREQRYRVLEARAAAARIVEQAQRAPVAVLFGSERSGLTNRELECAHALLRIPAAPDYPSLNLAMAVQIVSYEIHCAQLERARRRGVSAAPAGGTLRGPPASPEQLRRLYAHLAEVLELIEFRDRTQSGVHLMNRLRRLMQRAEPDDNEVNILRGILTAVQNRRRHAAAAPGARS